MLTKRYIHDTYLHSFYNGDKYSFITAVSYFGDYAVLMSGEYHSYDSGYWVEAVIDRNTGKNVIEGQCRPCEDKQDAIDVAMEMMAEKEE